MTFKADRLIGFFVLSILHQTIEIHIRLFTGMYSFQCVGKLCRTTFSQRRKHKQFNALICLNCEIFSQYLPLISQFYTGISIE